VRLAIPGDRRGALGGASGRSSGDILAAMSEARAEVVREMYAAFHGDDAAGSLAHFHPDVEVDVSRRMDGTIGRGHEFLGRVIAEWLGAFEGWREEIEEVHGAGSKVLVVAVQRGRGKSSGIEVEQRYAVVYEVADGLITAMTIYLDLAEARRAAGIDPLGADPAPGA
jgi:ketosteroid isomerase-like protein